VDEVGSRLNLDLLFLVTCADLAAVGPDVLNSWKVEVLSELHSRAAHKFAAEGDTGLEIDLSAEREGVTALLTSAEQSDAWFERQLAALPNAYLTKQSPTAIAPALRQLRALEPRAGIAWGNYLKDTDTIEFIAGVDQGAGRAIFSSMAGALTSSRLQILAAETDMLADGLMLLRYVVSEPESPGQPPAHRLEEICRALVNSIDTDQAPRFPKILGREQKEAAAALTNMPNDVRIDNEMSDRCTVIEVFTVDRRGLLYRLARALHDLKLVIRFAKIGTYLDQVVDVFYVTDRNGQKATSEDRLMDVRRTLLSVIAPAEDLATAGQIP
jgi:[protein-PII] uridylyltransferase